MKDPIGPGIQLWKSKRFFEAHEVWEKTWLRSNPLDKRFLGGLIQAAGAFHLKDRRPDAATRLLRSAWKKCFEGQIDWAQFSNPQLSSLSAWWLLHRVELEQILAEMEALQSHGAKATLKK